MLRLIFTTVLIAVLIADVTSQFYDFFSAFQPIGHPNPRYQYEVTTRKQKSEQKNTSRHDNRTIVNISKIVIDDIDKNTNRHIQTPKTTQDYHTTTVRTSRKTTKRTYENDTRQSKQKERNTTKAVRDRSDSIRLEGSRTHMKGSSLNNDDRIIFDDGKRNTVISYETTRRYDNDKRYQTQYPFTIRPGVRPAIVNGPPITNKPATQRPSFGPKPTEDDTSVSPELIIGPNEDYMNNVEKKRYVEMAERMCDKYKALDIKVVEVIPLLPSPEVVTVNVSTCSHNIPLVVGGNIVTVEEFPHMALLGWSKLRLGGYSWKCGGSLVSNRYVLTAAHCAYQERDNSVLTGAPRAVQLGSSYLDGQNAVIIKVAAVVRHPKYKQPKSYYDIALVKMVTTVTFSNVIKPACFGDPPPPGSPVIATGWGRTEFGGEQSQELRSVSIPVWDMNDCYEVLGTSRKIPDGPSSDSQICAGERRGGRDTCQGDSGGPAQIQDGLDGCTWRVVGVTSLGRSCGAANTPALYAKVQKAFISAVVFADQVTKNPTNNQHTNAQQWNSNQQTNGERNKNQQNGYTDSNTRRVSNNRGGSGLGYDSESIYHSNNNNNKPNGYYNDYNMGRVPDYPAETYYSGSKTWWT